MVSILDLKIGNITSLENSLKYLGVKYKIIKTSKEIYKSRILIIPGVGSFDHAMGTIIEKNLSKSIIDHAILKEKPILGICIGMQIFFEKSQEGKKKGLGILDGKITKLISCRDFKVPHVGFSPVKINKTKKIFAKIEDNSSFYFTNSYCLRVNKNMKFDNYCYTKHKYNFYGAVQKKNILGIQFHPELSHSSGLLILKNFFEIYQK